MAQSKSAIAAQSIVDECKRRGWVPEVRGNILSIQKTFPPQDVVSYSQCDAEYGIILEMLPRTRPGTDWGSDGSGIGGSVALINGRFEMKRSGGSVRILNALRKML